MGLSHKRKLDKDDQPKKRGRPRLTDKEKPKTTPVSTPVLPVSACTCTNLVKCTFLTLDFFWSNFV